MTMRRFKSVFNRSIQPIFILSILFLFLFAAVSPVKAGDSADPMIKITSLPIKQDPSTLMAALSKDVARDTGLNENFVTYYWQTFDAIYCPGCKGAGIKEPIFVDLYVPGFMTTEEIQKVMTSLAVSIEKHTDYSRKDIFMHTHIAEKEQLFIMGDIVTNWKQVGGPDDSEPAEK